MNLTSARIMPGLAIAVAGLVVGLATPAAAREVGHLINGSTIAKHSIPGNRLQANATVPNAKKLGGAPASAYVRGGGSLVSFTKVTGKTTAKFTLFKLQDGGTVTANCDNGTPASNFQNTTNAGQDLFAWTTNGGSPASLYFAGPPFGKGGGFSGETSPYIWHFEAQSTSGPPKMATLTMTAYATGSGCFWGVEGVSSLAISH